MPRYALSLLLFSCFMSFAEDGKVFLKTEPPGATISLCIEAEGKTEFKEFEKKTPALIQIPYGEQRVLLQLAGYKSATINIDVKGLAIIKPDVVSLEIESIPVDILYAEDGWSVTVDKQPVKDKDKPATTPCTIKLSLGAHEIQIEKDGFQLVQKLTVTSSVSSVEIKGKPTKALKSEKKLDPTQQPLSIDKIIIGNWKMTANQLKPIILAFKEDKKWTVGTEPAWGTWSVKDDKIILDYYHKPFGTATIQMKDKDNFTGKNTHANGDVFDWTLERVK